MRKRAIYKTFNHEKANSECGTMYHDNQFTKTSFGIVSLWYDKSNNDWFKDNQDKIRWNIKRILHKHFNTNFILIDITYAEHKNLNTPSLSFFAVEYTVTHKQEILFDEENISTHELINQEIIQYLYTLPMGFILKGQRKPRKKVSDTLNQKMTSDITLVENVS